MPYTLKIIFKDFLDFKSSLFSFNQWKVFDVFRGYGKNLSKMGLFIFNV